ncbi:hypothetical protein [Methylobacterium durans]|uniref:Uncharacterized protein n=1 Tax=Methylobacterium durans TaxID=2202825 RepID=A0A2U8WCV4_9HYPH|nr:hypothetical protein [Methylobacterium durans]AWN43977.1 hypothetical protein DK389_30070 [Methylobacterium durans]
MTHDPRCWFGIHAWQPAEWPPELVERLRSRGWSTQTSSRFEHCPRCGSSRTMLAEPVMPAPRHMVQAGS